MKSIAIFFNARRNQGGLFQYACTLVSCLQRYGGNYRITLFNTSDDLPVFPISDGNWNVISLPPFDVQLRLGIEYALQNLGRLGIPIKARVIPEYCQIAEFQPDLMIYVKPCIQAFQWPYPALMPVHDLQHRLQPRFPEVSALGEFHRREYLYHNALPTAAAILTDSDTGKEDVLTYYPVQPEHIFPIPYIIPPIVQETGTNDLPFGLKPGYLFYPAAFWPHKNHARLIRAISLLKNSDLKLRLVLTGSLSREYKQLRKLVYELGLENQILFTGYISDNLMPVLYRNALALVMPTFFGPTNIPIIEAWQTGCPVITSDIRGIKEQVGEAGILVNPMNTQSIAEGIALIARDHAMRKKLMKVGKKKVKAWGEREFAESLKHVLDITLERIRFEN